MIFAFDNTYARDLPGFSVAGTPAPAPQPRLLFLNRELAAELGAQLPPGADAVAGLFAGNALPPGAQPVAQAYAGHQFGHFSPQLGDGRALLLGEVIDVHGRRRDIAFKGSGRTAFSRGGDGRAAVGPMLREVLIGEAMHALGIPTTRALAVVATGEPVQREETLPGAVLTRVADSHLRVGTFEYFAARGDAERVRMLADYTLARHYPALRDGDEPYLALLRAVAQRQARLIAQWMNAGFIHGVMNTDNMALSGETIDYGPCAFLEAYDPRTVFSSIDHHGRYCYGNQPAMAQWNLARFAESLLVLLHRDEQQAVARATDVVHAFPDQYRAALLDGQRAKLGLGGDAARDAEDTQLAEDFLALLAANRADYTLSFRELCASATGNDLPLLERIADGEALRAWLTRWRARGAEDGAATPERNAARAAAMRLANPRIIARNHRVEEALAAASGAGERAPDLAEAMAPFEALLAAVRDPFSDDPALARYAEPAPPSVAACHKTFCGT
ncbi:MAG: protein adenylyltransferase SelO [Pseudomonadota bacterium]